MRLLPLSLSILLCLSACYEPQDCHYTAPKTKRSAGMAPVLANAAPTAGVMPEASWVAPGHWEELSAGNMRKALWNVTKDGKVLEVSVAAFPGDVGGKVANVNRWRSQLGLGPASAEAIEGDFEVVAVGEMEGLMIEVEGANETLLGVILPIGEYSYFFKAKGDAELLDQEKATVMEWLGSVSFE